MRFTYESLVDLVLSVSGMSRSRWDFLQKTMASDPAMNLLMKQEWNEEPRHDEAKIRQYYRQSDIWFANTFNSGYGGLIELSKGEVHSPDVWQRKFSEGLPAGARILDYGAGFLRDTWKLVTLGYKVDVAEIQGPVTLFLRQFVRLAGLEGRIGIVEVDSDFPITETYHGIACFETLEHILDPVALTKHLRDHLVPGGPFAFSVSFGGPEHAPYHIASNAPLGDPNVWATHLREIGFLPEWENPENTHVKIWRRT